MAIVVTDSKHYADIAAAIRSKNSEQAKYKPEQMAAAIKNISGGGGGGSNETETALIERTLTSYSNPDITKIGAYAFYRYERLKSISVPRAEQIETYGLNQAGIETADLSACKTLQYGAMQLTSCTKIDMMGGGSIAGAAISDSKLYTLIIRAEKITYLQVRDAFANTPIASDTGYIYVPKSLVEQYKAATNWVVYAAQIRAIEDYPEITGGAK